MATPHFAILISVIGALLLSACAGEADSAIPPTNTPRVAVSGGAMPIATLSPTIHTIVRPTPE
jgi:hypothetical protein